jgi:hypothetical protein
VRLRRLIAVASVVLVPASVVPASAALADADPASDVLVAASVFYPYSKPVSSQMQKTLNAEVAAAARAHFPIKVALIDAALDLGGLPALYGMPQQYAKFLDQELTFSGKPRLLVVMPAGYGVAGMSPAATAAAASLPKPAATTSDDLARSAIAAISKLAAASGHPVGGVSAPSGGGGGSLLDDLGFAVVAIVAVLAAAYIIVFRRRLARTR